MSLTPENGPRLNRAQPPSRVEAAHTLERVTHSIHSITFRITPYWSQESKQATQSLFESVLLNPEIGILAATELLDRFAKAPAEYWNTLASSLICVASRNTSLCEYIDQQCAVRGVISAEPERWKFLDTCLTSFDPADAPLVFEYGALQSLIKKSIFQYCDEEEKKSTLRALDTPPHPPQSDILQCRVALVSSLTPFLFSATLSELAHELTADIALLQNPFCTADGAALLYIQIANKGHEEFQSVVYHLLETAKYTSPKGAVLCGRILSQIAQKTHTRTTVNSLCSEQFQAATNPREKLQLARCLAEFTIYDPDLTESSIRRIAAELPNTPLEELPSSLDFASNLLEVYTHNAPCFEEGYKFVVDTLAHTPRILLDQQGQNNLHQIISTFFNLCESLNHKQTIAAVVAHTLELITRQGLCNRDIIITGITELFQNSPKGALEGTIVYLREHTLTEQNAFIIGSFVEYALLSPSVDLDCAIRLSIAINTFPNLTANDTDFSNSARQQLLDRVRRARDARWDEEYGIQKLSE